MALLTSEHKIQSDIVNIRRTCMIGDCIWIVQCAYRHSFVMYKFNIDTNTLLPVEYNVVDGHNSKYEFFEICSSNDKIYMITKNMLNVTQLLEFNTNNYEWRTLSYIDRSIPDDFFMSGNKMYIHNGSMMIMCMDTFEITNNVRLTVSVTDYVIIVEMNGVVYMVHIIVPGLISIHEYDERHDVFQKIIEKNEEGRVDIEPNFFPRRSGALAWSNNNKIHVALVSPDKILIDCFDVAMRQCHTVIDTNNGDDEVIDIFAKDNKVYVVSKRILDVVIQEIVMDPSLETIALDRMAQMVVDRQVKGDTCENVIPYGLRSQFKSVVERKIQQTVLGKMRMLADELSRLKIAEGNEVAQLMELQKQTDVEQQQLFWLMEISLYNIREWMRTIGKVKQEFLKLQSQFRIQLDEQQRGERQEMKLISDTDIMTFKLLSTQYGLMIGLPNSPMSYIIPRGTIESVVEQQLKHIEDIAELESMRNNQYDRSIFGRRFMNRFENEMMNFDDIFDI